MAVAEIDVTLPDGRTLHAYDCGGGGRPVFWQHGTPNIGSPPAPLFETAERLAIRFVSHDRPGYGGSTPHPGRDLASVAGDVTAVADALDIGRFAVMGHSGGGSHALAAAAVLADRVGAVVSVAGLAPFGAHGLNWFAGMSAVGEASLRAATRGRAAKEAHEGAETDADPGFVGADVAALEGEWGWFGSVVGPALAAGTGGLVDDDLAYVAPWGCDPAKVTVPALLLHGARDRVVPVSHGAWLADRVPGAELRRHDGDGHISVLTHAPSALEWLAERMG
jgi:pimeloyl-ACP methyl ester carboxylesterase